MTFGGDAFSLGGAQTVGTYRAEADREWSAYITPDPETGLSLQDVYQLDAIPRAQDAAYQDDPTSFYPHALSSEDRLRLAALAQGFTPAPTRRSW